MWDSPEGPKMVVHGGRSEVGCSIARVGWLQDRAACSTQPGSNGCERVARGWQSPDAASSQKLLPNHHCHRCTGASLMSGFGILTPPAGSRWRPPRRCSRPRGITTGAPSGPAASSSLGGDLVSSALEGCKLLLAVHGHRHSCRWPMLCRRSAAWQTCTPLSATCLLASAGTVEEASRPIGDRW